MREKERKRDKEREGICVGVIAEKKGDALYFSFILLLFVGTLFFI